MTGIKQAINLHVSVDCVLVGFDGEQFRVLLVRQVGKQQEEECNNMKLPGSLIYDDEDLDDAAKRVLGELTGLKNVKLTQFKAYGSKDRTRNPKDVMWLERFHQLDERKIDRIVTIAYLSLVKIDKRYEQLSDKFDACWTPVNEVKCLAFDHLQILQDALVNIRHYVENTPLVMFDLLPRKFTAAQLRAVYQLIYDKTFDVRNFHKKIALMPYVVALEEKQVGVCHRAARYYKFDRAIYNKVVR
ncbi:NUDIX hydrolase [Phocaeicola sp.]